MFMKLIYAWSIYILIYTKCNSYILRKKYLDNLFFVNYDRVPFYDYNKRCIVYDKANKGLRLKNQRIYKNEENDERKKLKNNRFTRCYLLNNNEFRQYDKKLKKRRKDKESNLYSSKFDKMFKESFNEDDKLKKSELISILACICTNIVIEFLKLKEEKKTDDFTYTFDYSVMNVLKMVNFEYDVNEELKKQKKKKKMNKTYTSLYGDNKKSDNYNDNINILKKNEDPTINNSLFDKERFSENDKIEMFEETKEINIDINNKNTKEENELLDMYIQKLEFNTLEMKDIKTYIDLFFGKNTYEKVFVKNNININKIFDVLHTALFDKTQERENVMQLQQFVDDQEKKLNEKKINVRNVNTFNDYLDKYVSLEEEKNINDLDNILYDDEKYEKEDMTREKKGMQKKKKKKQTKTLDRVNMDTDNNDNDDIDNDDNDIDNDDNDIDNDDNDIDNDDDNNNNSGGNNNNSGGNNNNSGGNDYNYDNNEDNNNNNNNNNNNSHSNKHDNYSNDHSIDQHNEDNHNTNNHHMNQKTQHNNYHNQDNRYINNINVDNNEDEKKDNEQEKKFLSGLSYALIKGCNMQMENNEEEMNEEKISEEKISEEEMNEEKISEEENDSSSTTYDDKKIEFCHNKNHIILLNFLYNNKYNIEFRSDIGVVAYDILNNEFVEDNIEECLIKDMKLNNIFDKDIISTFENIKNLNLNVICSYPYKKRFYQKQKLIKDINNKINFNNLNDKMLHMLLYIYFIIWGDDLHFYELKKVHIEHIITKEDINKSININNNVDNKNENISSCAHNFFVNYKYNDNDDILIDSDTYNNNTLSNNKNNLFDSSFFENDYISLNLKIFINNKKQINNFDELKNVFKSYKCNLSKYIQNFLNNINEKDLNFVTPEYFIKNYTYDAKDDFINITEILYKCKLQSRYISLFQEKTNSDEINKKRDFKLYYSCPTFDHMVNRKMNILKNKYMFIKNFKYNIFKTNNNNNNNNINLYNCNYSETLNGKRSFFLCAKKKKYETQNKKDQSKYYQTNHANNNIATCDFLSNDLFEEEIEKFEHIDNILGHQTYDNLNEEEIENTDNKKDFSNKSNDDDKNKISNPNDKGYNNNLTCERIKSSNNPYMQKMLEKQKYMNNILSLTNMNNNIKENINVLSYEDAYSNIQNELKNKSNDKKKKKQNNNDNNNNNNSNNNSSSNNMDEQNNVIEQFDEDKIEKELISLLQNKDNHDLLKDNEEKKNKELEKLNSEKEKINTFFKNMNVEIKLNKNVCVGCGAIFQSKDMNKFGFLKNDIYEKIINKDEDLDKKNILNEIYEENKTDDNISDMNIRYKNDSINELKEMNIKNASESDNENMNYDGDHNENDNNNIDEYIVDEKQYTCKRCFDLKYKNKINNNLIINYTNNNEIDVHDFEKYVINIFKKKCFIIYIVDVLDLYVYSNLKKLFNLYKKLHNDKSKLEGFYFCVNKIDLLSNYKEFTVKNYIYNFLKSNKINVLFKNIFLVSAKTGYNVKKLIYTVFIRSKNILRNTKQKKKQNLDDEEDEDDDDKDMDSLQCGKYKKEKKKKSKTFLFENLLNINSNNDDTNSDDKNNKIDSLNDNDLIKYNKELFSNDNKNNFSNEHLDENYYNDNDSNKYYSKNVNIYIVGNANSGKSSLINYLLKNVKNKEKKNFLISHSIIPGTTLKNIKIKLNKNITINDTPGIISNNSLLSYLNFEELKYVVCNKLKNKITSIYINQNDYIFIGGLLFIHILNIKKYYSIMSFFLSEKLPIIKRKNFSKDPYVFIKEKIKTGFLYPPFTEQRFDEINNFKKYYFNINNQATDIKNSCYDIHIQGMGYITFYAFENIEFNLYTLKNVDVMSRPSIMPYHKKFGKLNFTKKLK
ncbi:conserved Plasmodium protein, unknown function [Plasmodium sp. gorilla clade G2]|uniref:conserved Plasmodium protein, unknown function n=1 Tax=Plasmodium sp. gorilla clade G2 TaxID=880535 RepID=UPI000D2167E0|nr:conserved Plasmodium protein, unknown function [Plasmodium sp. gorilla clade G2]SOV18300.1 conserved Plasmodium protein, unknown function [Plasmodium sp. gorilla clade G2]